MTESLAHDAALAGMAAGQPIPHLVDVIVQCGQRMQSLGGTPLPEIARFFGIIIRLYAEPTAPHFEPHFHAYYQNHAVVYGIAAIVPMGGAFPDRQRRLVEAWAELHQGELMEAWERLQSGQLPFPIAPLK